MTIPINEQQAFNVVCTALEQQGGPSYWLPSDGKSTGCYYRGPFQRRCAIGYLIPDNEYSPELEHHSIRRLLSEGKMPASLKHLDKQFLTALQRAHDLGHSRNEKGYTPLDLANIEYKPEYGEPATVDKIVWEWHAPWGDHGIGSLLKQVGQEFGLDLTVVMALWPPKKEKKDD